MAAATPLTAALAVAVAATKQEPCPETRLASGDRVVVVADEEQERAPVRDAQAELGYLDATRIVATARNVEIASSRRTAPRLMG